MLWSLGWVIAPIYYSTLQATLGFTAGYTVDFVTIISLYTLATSLLWIWFHRDDRLRTEILVVSPEHILEGPTAIESA